MCVLMTSKICQLYYVQNLLRSKMGGASFTSFMGCSVQSREGVSFSYLMVGNVQRRMKKWVLWNLVGAKKWGPKNGNFQNGNVQRRMKKWVLREWGFSAQKITHVWNGLFLFPLTLLQLKSKLKFKIKMQKFNAR